MELELGATFDHQVINDDLPRAIAEVEEVVAKHAEFESIHST
jgi:guanylate kinase